MRGKLELTFTPPRELRITPAHAGKTHPSHAPLQPRSDHPRACGENPVFLSSNSRLPGSPPRMRGKPARQRREHLGRRITPAHAGKTSKRRLPLCRRSDHPRACGENREAMKELGIEVGSPPRMRGKLPGQEKVDFRPRITPAHAGKTNMRKWRISVVDPSPQPQSSLTSRRADASIGSQRAPCAAPV